MSYLNMQDTTTKGWALEALNCRNDDRLNAAILRAGMYGSAALALVSAVLNQGDLALIGITMAAIALPMYLLALHDQTKTVAFQVRQLTEARTRSLRRSTEHAALITRLRETWLARRAWEDAH